VTTTFDLLSARLRVGARVALAIASIGVAQPYGTASGPIIGTGMTPLEIGVSAIAAILGIGIIVELLSSSEAAEKARPILFAATTFVWVVVSVYEFIHPGNADFLWRLGHGIPPLGWAVLAGTLWRLSVAMRREES
jgi:hypothetical protein